MDLYYVAAAILFITQISQLRSIYSLEIELFKQKIRFLAYKTYYKVQSIFHYFKTSPPEIKPEVCEKPVIELYENKYKIKYDEMEGISLTEEERTRLKTNILYETTPIGNVILFYDETKESFEYYSDKVIPFRFLETVSRKYVVSFNCKSIHKDKETNRYTYLGKIANFSFLQKPSKNKKLNMSFKEYKNMKI